MRNPSGGGDPACFDHEARARLRRHPGRSALALGLGAPTTGAVSSGPRCPTGGKGLLRTASLRAYSVGTVERACLFSSGRPYGLTGEGESLAQDESDRPSIEAAGPMVAADVEDFSDPNFSTNLTRVINLRTRMLVRTVSYGPRPDVLRVAAQNGSVVLGFMGCDREGAGRTSSRCHPNTIYAADGPAFDPPPPATRLISPSRSRTGSPRAPTST